MRQRRSTYIQVWVLFLGLSACSGAPPKPEAAEPSQGRPAVPPLLLNPTHELHQLIPYSLKIRRPPGPGADPKVGPGGTDYTSHPLPDAKFDCETPTFLFSELKLDQVLQCVEDVKEASFVHYRLKRVPVPYLELQNPEDAPACLRTALPRIPVPREIFFESNDEGRVLCYSARLNIEANETAGLKLPTHRLDVRVDFPILAFPTTDDETRMLLLSWALAPFWNENMRSLSAHIVPDALCNACLGEKNRLKPKDPTPVPWPAQ
jgi:hypothetical protein